MKNFDVNIAATITTWLGATTITTSGETIPTSGATNEVMSWINGLQATLTDVQTKLDILVNATTPTVTPTPVVTPNTWMIPNASGIVQPRTK